MLPGDREVPAHQHGDTLPQIVIPQNRKLGLQLTAEHATIRLYRTNDCVDAFVRAIDDIFDRLASIMV